MEKILELAGEFLKGAALIVFIPAIINAAPKYEIATFAGGCFWCTQPVFEYIKGVIKVEAGYVNGLEPNPTYEDYMDKGYAEGVQVTYDPAVVSYAELVDAYWKQIDPTDAGGQFYDRGPNYRPAIFYHNEAQRKEAERSKAFLAKSGKFGKPIVVTIELFKNFFPAEGYHQDYKKKNPVQYFMYRQGSGRDAFSKKIWGDQNKNEGQDKGKGNTGTAVKEIKK